MKLSKTLKSMLEDATKTDAYWAEHAKLEFSITLEQRRRAAKLSYADIARKMGTSAAYITKVFRGDSNMTIETLVRLARACGGQLDIQVVDGPPANVKAMSREPAGTAPLQPREHPLRTQFRHRRSRA